MSAFCRSHKAVGTTPCHPTIKLIILLQQHQTQTTGEESAHHSSRHELETATSVVEQGSVGPGYPIMLLKIRVPSKCVLLGSRFRVLYQPNISAAPSRPVVQDESRCNQCHSDVIIQYEQIRHPTRVPTVVPQHGFPPPASRGASAVVFEAKTPGPGGVLVSDILAFRDCLTHPGAPVGKKAFAERIPGNCAHRPITCFNLAWGLAKCLKNDLELNRGRSGRAIRQAPATVDLSGIVSPYPHVHMYESESSMSGYQWSLGPSVVIPGYYKISERAELIMRVGAIEEPEENTEQEDPRARNETARKRSGSTPIERVRSDRYRADTERAELRARAIAALEKSKEIQTHRALESIDQNHVFPAHGSTRSRTEIMIERMQVRSDRDRADAQEPWLLHSLVELGEPPSRRQGYRRPLAG
ncbi:hypothetical protein B0H17DRAFT_1142535 [Mycena rosella]|uniref:Uncharacterized protein n=1 Tax=Mycena rosella TaxID=1033263 RepID=A0AAD7D0Y3_MYCRO|nr:hypothetical protein B0H17DRAFT_1142535 [Mycena rosella]